MFYLREIYRLGEGERERDIKDYQEVHDKGLLNSKTSLYS